MKRLQPGGWLDDITIDVYLKIVKTKALAKGINVWCLSAHLPGIIQARCEKRMADRCAARAAIAPAEVDFVIAPNHTGTNHWQMVVVSIREQLVLGIDSIGKDVPAHAAKAIAKFAGLACDRNSGSWKLMPCTHAQKQTNDSDCGVLVRAQAYHVATGKGVQCQGINTTE